ncbi:MAG: hypothetical protein FD166_1763 [Bacteroidetes bacterium]|nr:MAG: hypothetical protein FD166_1763 [Bacteroidota bacterium]
MSGIRLTIAAFLFWILAYETSAQEMHGFVNSNYAGITGSLINPTSILNSKLYLDITPFGLHFNLDNDYIFLAKDEYKFSRFVTPGAQFPEHGEDSRVFYDNFNAELKNAYTDIRIFGPSAMFAFKDQAFGISTGFRTIVSGRNIPYEMAKFAVEGTDFWPLYRINFINERDARIASLAYAEIAGTYSRVLYKKNRDHWTAGLTLKGLFGTAGAFGYVDNIDYMIPNGDTLIVYNTNAQMGISLPVDYTNNDFLLPGKLFRGKGMGIDVGITYQKKVAGHSNKGYSMPCEYPYEPYRYKIGVSVLDLGRIKFKKDARLMELKNEDTYWADVSRYSFTNIDNLLKTVSYEFSGDSTALITANAFSIWLPAALSVQADFRITKAVYLNGTLIHPIIVSKAETIRPPQLSLTPRWESDHLEVALPFILYDYVHPRLGLSVRFHKLVIGTDKLGGFFGMSNFYGMDFYVMLKFTFLKGECRNFDKRFGCGNLEYKQKY